MNKIILKKRVLECIEQDIVRREYSAFFKDDIEYRIELMVSFRKTFKDVIPLNLSEEEKSNYLNYISALKNEDYETCMKYTLLQHKNKIT